MSSEPEIKGVRIVKIVSESRKPRGERPRPGYRRVQAIVRIHDREYTRHGDTKDGVFLMMKLRTKKSHV